jgi:hypothetical protein
MNNLNVDDLAQEIRRIDGRHDLGAGALAEALLPFIEQAVLQSPEIQGLREWREWPTDMPPLDTTPVLALHWRSREIEIVYGRLLDEVDDYSHWMHLPPPPQHDSE